MTTPIAPTPAFGLELLKLAINAAEVTGRPNFAVSPVNAGKKYTFHVTLVKVKAA